ncbi:MAG: hypothetical protein JRJ29_17715, partial [Deltaproteobacteria bacterium]|nr:hypothetical protein [Deltaproteobacteria bacterium]
MKFKKGKNQRKAVASTPGSSMTLVIKGLVFWCLFSLVLLDASSARGQTPIPRLATGGGTGNKLIYQTGAPPLVLLVMGRNHKLYYEAYNDASDLNGDGNLDAGYDPDIDYYGYFDSYKAYTYTYNSGLGVWLFEPTSSTPDKKVRGPKEWSGDFLNYLTTSRMDALRKVLYGGYRSIDTPTETVLERVYVPQDAHTWGKEYESIQRDGYDIRDYSPLGLPEPGTRHLFASTTLEDPSNPGHPDLGRPLLRVLPNNSHRIWEWVAKERPVACDPGQTKCDEIDRFPVDYEVRVLVCDQDAGVEANCKQYPSGLYKPTGILQAYGESGRMYFGLLTGSYTHNTRGGVLRKPVGPITDEIDPFTGRFKYRYDASVQGIIKTIDGLRVTGFVYSSSSSPEYSYDQDCGWITDRPDFTYGDSGSLDNNLLGLPKPEWDNPYGNENYCARPFMLVLSDIYPTYDSDQLPGSYFGSPPQPHDLADLNVADLADRIFQEEEEAGYYYIGQVGSADDDSCLPKGMDGFGSARGLCPEEPTKQGAYYSAAVAYYGRTTDINPVRGEQNVLSYMVGLASPLPRINIRVGTRGITMV